MLHLRRGLLTHDLPSYCQSPDDVEKLRRGVKKIIEIAQTEPLASLLDHDDQDPQLDHGLHTKTDEELSQIVRQRAETLYHPASTCRMAPLEKGGVVDSHQRVYGIRSLRVCDASTFPELVSGHTVSFVITLLPLLRLGCSQDTLVRRPARLSHLQRDFRTSSKQNCVNEIKTIRRYSCW